MPRPPHPRLFGWRTVAVCQVVGVVVNVGVAWGLALWVQLGNNWYESDVACYRDTPGGSWFEDEPNAVRVERLSWPPDGLTHPTESPDARVRLGWPWYRGFTTDAFVSGNIMTEEAHVVLAFRAGLPLRSAACFVADPDTPDHEEVWGVDTGLANQGMNPLHPMWPTARLPLRPEFPGFVVNSLFYGGLALAAVVAPRSLRRRWRVRRGRCVGCGYELAGLVVCPECGLGRVGGVASEPGASAPAVPR